MTRLTLCAYVVVLSVAVHGALAEPRTSTWREDSDRARRLAREGKSEAALALYRQWMDVSNAPPEALHDYVLTLCWANRHGEALEVYEQAERPDDAWPSYVTRGVARAYRDLARPARAADLYRLLLDRDPADDDARLGYAWCSIEQGRPQEAGLTLDAFAPSNRLFHAAQAARLTALRAQARWREGLDPFKILATCAQPYADFRPQVRAFLTEAPAETRAEAIRAISTDTNLNARMAMADAFLVEGRWEEAEQPLFAVLDRGERPTGAVLTDWLNRMGAEASAERVLTATARIRAALPCATDALLAAARLYLERKDYTNAEARLTEIMACQTDHIEGLFALAVLYWDTGRLLDALDCYDRLLEIRPGMPGAINLKSRLLSAMGACHTALDFAEAHSNAVEPVVWRELRLNAAAQRIQWDEPHLAVPTLTNDIAGESRPFERLRPRFDLLVAQRRMQQMEAVTNGYAQLERNDIDVPYWGREMAADAYLFLRDPEKAESLYRSIVEERPKAFNPRMALYYALVERGRFGQAGDALARARDIAPEWERNRGLLRYGYGRQQADLATAWLEAYQDRTRTAEGRFERYRSWGPANLPTRTGLGTMQFWSGRPREALETLDIVITMGEEPPRPRPPYVDEWEMGAKNSRIGALNDAHRRGEARAYAAELLRRNAMNTHTRAIVRGLEIEDSPRFYFDGLFTQEHPGTEESLLYAKLSDRVATNLEPFLDWVWKRTRGPGLEAEIERVGAGIAWLARPAFSLTGSIDADRKKMDDPGYYAAVDIHDSDAWSFGASFDSFSLDVPMRVAVEDLKSRRTAAYLEWRPHEYHALSMTASLNALEDGNRIRSLAARARQAVYRSAYFKAEASLSGAYSDYRLTDVPYFSPDHAAEVMGSLRAVHTFFRRYDHAWSHHLIGGYGRYAQADYPALPIWDIRYEHDVRFCDRMGLLIGISFARRVYDGENTDVDGAHLTFWRHF